MRQLIFDKAIGRKYKLYFVNYEGLWLIIEDYSKHRITRMFKKLKRLQNNLILK